MLRSFLLAFEIVRLLARVLRSVVNNANASFSFVINFFSHVVVAVVVVVVCFRARTVVFVVAFEFCEGVDKISVRVIRN